MVFVIKMRTISLTNLLPFLMYVHRSVIPLILSRSLSLFDFFLLMQFQKEESIVDFEELKEEMKELYGHQAPEVGKDEGVVWSPGTRGRKS